MKLFFAFLFLSFSVKAAIYDCKIEENLKVIEKIKVTAADHQRVKVSSGESYVFYFSTFDHGLVELEAFLPSAEMRIYSKGQAAKSAVSLTSWQREGLLEFTCSQSLETNL